MADDPLAVVKGWFEVARMRPVSINLYYVPYAQAWAELTNPITYKGIDTGLVDYQGSVYRVSYGPGDCEETLWFLGDTNDRTNSC